MNKVLFFAHLRDVVGEESLALNAAGKTVSDLKIELTAIYNLPKMETVMTAINEEFASNDEVISEGDVIAFIPPVSGG
ncbi:MULTISPECIES: molybdopterin converting factor subunit 1 [Bacillus]|uniref:Molybdopterin synthase sulfur carrier subunit n=1 Tax=Bacillus salipaludis TaxID=2547811 RepID=A0A4V3AUD4_9BACI|nr:MULTISPECIES: molybdopterin converting factor subunit 1 [Bacillus]MDQ6595232.1 molybdopterin converting factor subunit 1 [Bacillus salipaludis]TDK63919.1 molybdopterin converting factor subunit 1 [Bacillus salipaludis]WHY91887.1 molybdopterin converting factor subunit 1 [Neobacillus cucumis]